MITFKKVLLMASLIVAAAGCGSKSDTATEAISDPSSNVSQTAMSQAGSTVPAPVHQILFYGIAAR